MLRMSLAPLRATVRRALFSRASRTTMWSMLNVLIATGVGMVTARYLGADLRGTLAILLSVAGLTVLVGTGGTNVAIRRRLPREETTALQYLQLSAILFVPYIVLLQIVAHVVAVWVDPAFFDLPVSLAFTAYGAAFFWSNQLLDLLNATGQVPLAAATNAFGTAVCLAGIGVVVLFQGELPEVALAYAASMVAQLLAALLLLKSHLRRAAGLAERGRRRLLLDGSRLMGLNLGQALTYRADTILIGALSSTHAVGIYAVATTPAAVLMLPATALGQVVMNDAANGKVTLRRILKHVLMVEMVVGVFAILLWAFADFVVVLLFGQDFASAADVLRILLIAQLALVPFLVLSRALVGFGSTWRASLPSLLGAPTLIGCGIAWIPSFGPLGGAWASVVAYSVMSLVSAAQVALVRHGAP